MNAIRSFTRNRTKSYTKTVTAAFLVIVALLAVKYAPDAAADFPASSQYVGEV